MNYKFFRFGRKLLVRGPFLPQILLRPHLGRFYLSAGAHQLPMGQQITFKRLAKWQFAKVLPASGSRAYLRYPVGVLEFLGHYQMDLYRSLF